MRNKDKGLLFLFCGYGFLMAAADLATAAVYVVMAARRKKNRLGNGLSAAFYLFEGCVYFVVYLQGRRLYAHKNFRTGAVEPFPERAPVAPLSPVPVAMAVEPLPARHGGRIRRSN